MINIVFQKDIKELNRDHVELKTYKILNQTVRKMKRIAFRMIVEIKKYRHQLLINLITP